MKKYQLLKSAGAVCLLSLVVIACSKYENPSATTAAGPVEKGIIVHCSPYQNVTGYNGLCSELNVVTNCSVLFCENTISTTLTHFLLTDVNNSLFIFSNTQLLTPAQQNAVMVSAKTWANANTPAGYYVHKITYTPDIVVGGPTSYAGIDISVVYRKCLGGGGGPTG